ncbi:MAG: YfcC family protein, partial [Bacteroidota bacterium]
MATLRKFPDTLLLLMGFLLLFTLLTWIVPAGEYERTELNGRTVVVPGTYERVEATPQGPGDFLMAPFKGFVAAADILAFIFLVGGAFAILNATGAISAGLQTVVRASQTGRFPKWAVIPFVMILFSLCGATFGMSEEVLVFVLITVPLALALGYDVITGVAISFVGAGAGFAGAFLNPFTVGIAQGIAELPPFSGIEYRLVIWVLTTTLAIVFVMRYARRIEADPGRSLMAGLPAWKTESGASDMVFTRRHGGLLLLLAVALGLLILGAVRWGWYIAEITALFVAFGIIAAAIGRLSIEESLQAFREGAGEMLAPGLVIALAKGLIVLAEDGHIID